MNQKMTCSLREEFSLATLPRTSALLENPECLSAVMHVAAKRKVDNYHSLLDFFLCELDSEHKLKCMAFYRGDGPNLQELSSKEELAALDERLVQAVHVAMSLQNEKPNWTGFRYAVRVSGK